MTDAHAKAIREARASIPVIRTGTVITNYSDALTATYVKLDNDPFSIPVRALAGTPLPAGMRVLLASYPPRGLVIVGRLDGVDTRPKDSEAGNVIRTTNSTTFVALGITSTDVTIPYPPSGIFTVTVGGGLQNSALTVGIFGIVGFEIRDTNASGTVRLAASDDRSFFLTQAPSAGFQMSGQRTYVATGLPASGTAFVRPMFRVAGVNTLSYVRPFCIVQPSLT